MKNITMNDVKRNNRKAGFYFFSPDTMRFFRSKIESKLYDNQYFITSEQFNPGIKRYTVRQYDPKTHKISTVGKFDKHKCFSDALDVIEKLLAS